VKRWSRLQSEIGKLVSEGVDVCMVAPKGPGHIVRREYAAGRGVPVVVAVEQDPDGKTWPLCLAYAKALGALRAGWGAQDFGVYAEVVSGGRVALGDKLGGKLGDGLA